ncbi:MAG: hypothetical protein E6H63_10240, partial [Betaproteobacteria bacterium]
MKPIVKKVLGLVVVVSALASVVAGREQPSYQPARKSAARTDTRAPAAADIDLAKLAARADEGATADAFARRNFAPIVPAAEAQAQAPAKPTAPPLPFKYLGRMIDRRAGSAHRRISRRQGHRRQDRLHVPAAEDEADARSMRRVVILIAIALALAACTSDEALRQSRIAIE